VIEDLLHPKSYQFANALWCNFLYSRGNFLRTFYSVLAFSFSPWVGGLFISSLFGMPLRFVTTPIFYIAAFAIFVTVTALIYGSAQHYRIYSRLLECFDLSEMEKRDILHETMDSFFHFRAHIRASFLILSGGSLLAISGFYFWAYIRPFSELLGTCLPRFVAFSKYNWYSADSTKCGLIIVLIYLIFISIALGTSTSIMIRMPKLLLRVRRLNPSLPPRLVKYCFAPTASLYAWISVLWLVGAICLLYFFGLNGDWLSYACVIGPFLLGLFAFSLPQIAYVHIVFAAEERYSEAIKNRLAPIPLASAPMSSTIRQTDCSQANELVPLLELLTHDQWVYPLHQTYIVVGMYALSFVSYSKLLALMASTLP
jgi:hypothetical protein